MTPADVRTAVGILGFIISCLMFLYPAIAVRRIWVSRSVGQSSPYSYLVTLGNCFVWALYGLPAVHLNSLFTLSFNSFGCVTHIAYISIYLWFSDHTRRRKVVCWLIIEGVILAVLTASVFYFGRYLGRSRIAGVICIISNFGAYAAEIRIMRLVIKTKSVEQMPLVATLLFFVSSVVWCAFSVIIVVDKYLLITYGSGSLVAATELIVHVYIILPSVAYRLMLRLVRHLSR